MPACFRIDREGNAPVRDSVKNAVRKKRRRFLVAAAGPDDVRPGEAESLHVGRINLAKKAVACLRIVAAIGEPFLALRCILQRIGVRLTPLLCDAQPSYKQRGDAA